MEQVEFLIGFAQLALVLTGFMSLFMVFFIDETKKSRVNTHHAASILVGSVLTLGAALAPILIANYGISGEALWWWSSLSFAGLTFIYFVTMLSMTLQLTRAQFKEAGYLHMASSYLLGIAAFFFNLLNLLGDANPGHYSVALLINFLVPLIAFVTFSVQKVFHW